MSATFEQASGPETHPTAERTYHWTFSTGESLRVVLNNPRGEIRVTGWDRPEVEIRAVKQPDHPTRSRSTRVEAEQQDNTIVVRTITDPVSRLIEQGLLRGVAADVIQALADLVSLGIPAAVSLVVQAPRHAELEINAVSSRVDLSGFDGTTRVRSVNGDVTLSDLAGYIDLNSVSGTQIGRSLTGRVTANTVGGRMTLTGQIDDLRAKTVSGSVEYAGSLSDNGHYLLNTVSGAVTLELPADSRASFSAQGVSLGVHSDLPALIAHEKRSPGNNQWSGRLNGGGARVHFQTVSGTLYLRELPGAAPRPEIPAQPATTPVSPSLPAQPAAPPIAEQPTAPPAAPPTPKPPSAAEAPPVTASAETEQLRILGALERGEISVDEALAQLEQTRRRSSGTAN